jgi:BirA family transcriptional regulator, biotin operon repressor / biotin---[acetyl-CoA-carboxylase] ligase
VGVSDDEAADLARAPLAALLPDRPLRTFPAMLSTEAEALRWARTGAEAGSVVVTGYQASPRGRSGLSYADRFTPGRGLGCSLVVRPAALAEEREGWLYTAALVGVHDVVGGVRPTTSIAWPDRCVTDGRTSAALGVHGEPAGGRIVWAVITILVPDAEPPRGPLLAALLAGVEARLAQDPGAVLVDARTRCSTLGRRVIARVLPMGPASPSFLGVAEDLVDDGGLRIATDDGPRVVVRPQSLGALDAPEDEPVGPPGIG